MIRCSGVCIPGKRKCTDSIQASSSNVLAQLAALTSVPFPQQVSLTSLLSPFPCWDQGHGDLHHLSGVGTALSYGRGSSLPGTCGIPTPCWGQPPKRPGLEAKWGQIILATGGRTWKSHPLHTTNNGLDEICWPCDTFFFFASRVVKNCNAITDDYYCVLRLCFQFSFCLFCGSFFP